MKQKIDEPNTISIRQLTPSGEREWILQVDPDGTVTKFRRYTEHGILAAWGDFGSPISAEYWRAPPQDMIREIEDRHGLVESVVFSHCPVSPHKWGWLAKTGNMMFIITPSGWYECGVPRPGGMTGREG